MGALSDSQMLYRLGKAGFVNGALCYVDDAAERRPNGFVAHNGGWVKTIDPGDPNRLVVVPFHQFTKIEGHPSHGLGSYGIDLQAGYNWKYLDKHKLAAMGIPYVRPGMKNLPWVTVEGDPSKPSADQLIIVPPRSAILCETLQRVYIPRDCWGLVAGKSTWARLFIDLNTTPLEPTWQGVITLEVTNNSDVAVAIEPGEGICQMVLIRGDQPERFPLLTGYADRDSPTYQNQAGVCEAKV